MLILYATQTGNAKYVAEEIGREGTRRYIKAQVMAMDDYDIIQLPTEKIVIFVIATTGQGEPPATMKRSWKFLTKKDLPTNSLSDVNFTVFGLGDSSYEIFGAMARKLYQRLIQLGANGFHERSLGDDQHDFGYEAEFDPWLDSLWENLYKLDPSLRPTNDIKPEDSIEDSIYDIQIIKRSDIDSLEESDKAFYDEFISQNKTLQFYPKPMDAISGPHFGKLIKNEVITSSSLLESENKETRHIELEFSENEIDFNPGDVGYILPKNNTDVVSQMLERQGLEPDDLIKITIKHDVDSSMTPIKYPQILTAKELFEYWVDILGVPNRYFFKVLAHYTDDEVRKQKLLELGAKTADGK